MKIPELPNTVGARERRTKETNGDKEVSAWEKRMINMQKTSSESGACAGRGHCILCGTNLARSGLQEDA